MYTFCGPQARARDAMSVQRLDGVVVGGGQAGLSAAYHMQQQGMRYTVLEVPDCHTTHGTLGLRRLCS